MGIYIILIMIAVVLILPLLRLKWLKHDGRWRAFLLHKPTQNNDAQLPLIIVLHGAGGNVYRIAKFAKFTRFNRLADRNQFMVVYPVAIKKNWNDSQREGTQAVQQVDDVGFIQNLIAHLQTQHNINQRQIYVVGMSNGGAMAYRLSCELNDKIAAIATVSSFMPVAVHDNCQPKQSMPVLIMNGTEDPLIPMQGGHLQFRGKILGHILSVEAVVKFWSTVNDCQHHETIDIAPVAGDETYVQHDIYMNQHNSKQVELYTVFGGGHTWSGSPQYLPKSMVGCASQAVDATQIIWDFVQQHQR